MAIMKCKCGQYLSNNEVPNDVELFVYTDKEWEEKVNIGVIDSINIPRPRNSVWRCPKCQRVFVWNETDEYIIKVYALEDEYKD